MLILMGLIVTMHEGTYTQEAQISGLGAERLDVLFLRARMHCGNNNLQKRSKSR